PEIRHRGLALPPASPLSLSTAERQRAFTAAMPNVLRNFHYPIEIIAHSPALFGRGTSRPLTKQPANAIRPTSTSHASSGCQRGQTVQEFHACARSTARAL